MAWGWGVVGLIGPRAAQGTYLTRTQEPYGEWTRTLRDAGWDPFDPGDECGAETNRPAMGSWLEPGDVVGIHWILVSVELERQFKDALGGPHMFAASLFVLAELEVQGGASLDSATRLYNVLCRWYASRYSEASRRLHRATPEEFEANPRAYEPAASFMVLSGERGWVDFDGNRAAALAGLREVESRGILGGDASEIVLPELSDNDVECLLEVMMTKNPGQKLFWVTDEGRFRLSPRNVRDAIESNVGAVKTIHEPVQEGRREGDEGITRPEPSILERVADKDALADVRSLLHEYRERHASESLEVMAAEHYLRIRGHETTAEAVARKHGVHPEALRKRVRSLDEFLRRHRSS
jgi:hypothetical protein